MFLKFVIAKQKRFHYNIIEYMSKNVAVQAAKTDNITKNVQIWTADVPGWPKAAIRPRGSEVRSSGAAFQTGRVRRHGLHGEYRTEV